MILADEPTGNLDTKTSIEIMELFQRLNLERGITIVFVTHNPETADYVRARRAHPRRRDRERRAPASHRRHPSHSDTSWNHASQRARRRSAASTPGKEEAAGMKIFEAIRIAMRALAANKLRSILTMLGIIIGVGAVIALMSIGRGVEKYVTDQFAGLGSNLLFVAPGNISDGPPRLRQTPGQGADHGRRGGASARAAGAGGASQRPASTRRLAQRRAQRQGSERPGQRHDRQLSTRCATGRPRSASYFTQDDFDERQRVVLLGADTYKELFPNGEYPIDQTIQLNNLNFRVIGVMESKGGGPGGNLDKSAFVPLTTAQDRLFKQKTVNGQYELSVIYASVEQCRAHGRGAAADHRTHARAPQHQVPRPG